MSISGTRTAYDEDEIAEVAKRTGTRPRRPIRSAVTSGPAPGCACRPPWPALVVHTGAGDVAVVPSATPGGLACLHQAYCTGCGAACPGPFRACHCHRGGAGAPA